MTDFYDREKSNIRIIKRNGKAEYFDVEKLELTIIRASLNSHLSDDEGKRIAGEVVGKIKEWIKGKDEVASEHLFHKVWEYLKESHRDVAFMYGTHRDIS
jgi:transcriptional regulator NrdR family protein